MVVGEAVGEKVGANVGEVGASVLGASVVGAKVGEVGASVLGASVVGGEVGEFVGETEGARVGQLLVLGSGSTQVWSLSGHGRHVHVLRKSQQLAHRL